MLVIKQNDDKVPEPSAAYQTWYERNKQRIAQERKEKYESDPAYRQRRVEASAKYRKGQRTPPLPAGLSSVAEAAKRIGAAKSTIRGWRRKQLSDKQKLLPEPSFYKGRPVFTEQQVFQLQKLKHFFDNHGNTRPPQLKEKLLKQLRAEIFANWN